MCEEAKTHNQCIRRDLDVCVYIFSIGGMEEGYKMLPTFQNPLHWILDYVLDRWTYEMTCYRIVCDLAVDREPVVMSILV